MTVRAVGFLSCEVGVVHDFNYPVKWGGVVLVGLISVHPIMFADLAHRVYHIYHSVSIPWDPTLV